MKPEQIRTLQDLAKAKRELREQTALTRQLMQESAMNSGKQAFLNYILPLGVGGLVAWGIKKFNTKDQSLRSEPSEFAQAQVGTSPKPLVEGIRMAGKVITTLLPTVLSLIESYQAAEEE